MRISPIEGAVQKETAPQLLRQITMHSAWDWNLAGYQESAECTIPPHVNSFGTICHPICTVHFDISNNAFNWEQNASNQVSFSCFYQASHSKLIVFGIFGLLPRTKSGKQLVLILFNLYSKCTCAISTQNISSTHVVHIFLDRCSIIYVILDIIPSDIDQHLVNKYLFLLCNYLGVERIAATAYHALSNKPCIATTRLLQRGLYCIWPRRHKL